MLELDANAGAPADLIKDGTDASFVADVIEASKEVPVIVDFWAPWCGPCKTLGPAIEAAVTNAKGRVKLVKIDVDGNICQDTPYFINPAGFTIHSAIHAARHDAGCVIHVHTPYGVAVSVQKGGLRRYTQFSLVVNNDLAYHDYEGIALDLDERTRIVNDLGDKNLLMLRNHGTLTLGENCAIAFLRMYFLENACKTQIFAQAGGSENLHEEPQAMADTVAGQSSPAFQPGSGDNLIWPGLMRKLNRVNPGYDL